MIIPAGKPGIHAIKELRLPAYEELVLPNGMPVYLLRGSAEPVMKMEVVFRAGASVEHKPGVAEVMAAMLSEGTQSRPSAELAETVESLGATLFTKGGVDTIRVRLLTLTRFFPVLAPVITEVICQPAFNAQELAVYTGNKIERLRIDLTKNEVIAYRHLTEHIFGQNHPYGRNAWPEDFQQITPGDLHLHHGRYIHPANGFVLLSGDFGDAEIDVLTHTLGEWEAPPGLALPPADLRLPPADLRLPPADLRLPLADLPLPPPDLPLPPPDLPLKGEGEGEGSGPSQHLNASIPLYSGAQSNNYYRIDGPQHHQAAVRIGRKLFPQTHPDFNGLYVLNTVLGGYFGSRLMNEIRERQGLTYGIYSSVDSFAEDGCFYISTETATANTGKVIAAIQKEVLRLQNGLIPPEELEMARNYLMGHLMTQIDGAFAIMDLVKSLKIEFLDDKAFGRLVDTILQITPARLKELAREYLNLEEWTTIVVE